MNDPDRKLRTPPPTEKEVDDLRLSIDVATPLPVGFSTGYQYTSPLRIYFLAGWYYLFDCSGYLGKTSSERAVCAALRAQSVEGWAMLRKTLLPEFAAEIDRKAEETAMLRAKFNHEVRTDIEGRWRKREVDEEAQALIDSIDIDDLIKL